MTKKLHSLGVRCSFFWRVAMALNSGLNWMQIAFMRRVLGMDIGKDVSISLRARIDFTYPRGVHIGDGTYIASGAVIFAHDMTRVLHTHTYIGVNCFIGVNAIIMPGIRIGDYCIVSTGAVVTRNVPSGTIVDGNPAEIVKFGIMTEKWGQLTRSTREEMIHTGEIKC